MCHGYADYFLTALNVYQAEGISVELVASRTVKILGPRFGFLGNAPFSDAKFSFESPCRIRTSLSVPLGSFDSFENGFRMKLKELAAFWH
jgi:hypothetical protein